MNDFLSICFLERNSEKEFVSLLQGFTPTRQQCSSVGKGTETNLSRGGLGKQHLHYCRWVTTCAVEAYLSTVMGSHAASDWTVNAHSSRVSIQRNTLNEMCRVLTAPPAASKFRAAFRSVVCHASSLEVCQVGWLPGHACVFTYNLHLSCLFLNSNQRTDSSMWKPRDKIQARLLGYYMVFVNISQNFNFHLFSINERLK